MLSPCPAELQSATLSQLIFLSNMEQTTRKAFDTPVHSVSSIPWVHDTQEMSSHTIVG
jgi:hypothetical protein